MSSSSAGRVPLPILSAPAGRRPLLLRDCNFLRLRHRRRGGRRPRSGSWPSPAPSCRRRGAGRRLGRLAARPPPPHRRPPAVVLRPARRVRASPRRAGRYFAASSGGMATAKIADGEREGDLRLSRARVSCGRTIAPRRARRQHRRRCRRFSRRRWRSQRSRNSRRWRRRQLWRPSCEGLRFLPTRPRRQLVQFRLPLEQQPMRTAGPHGSRTAAGGHARAFGRRPVALRAHRRVHAQRVPSAAHAERRAAVRGGAPLHAADGAVGVRGDAARHPARDHRGRRRQHPAARADLPRRRFLQGAHRAPRGDARSDRREEDGRRRGDGRHHRLLRLPRQARRRLLGALRRPRRRELPPRRRADHHLARRHHVGRVEPAARRRRRHVEVLPHIRRRVQVDERRDGVRAGDERRAARDVAPLVGRDRRVRRGDARLGRREPRPVAANLALRRRDRHGTHLVRRAHVAHRRQAHARAVRRRPAARRSSTARARRRPTWATGSSPRCSPSRRSAASRRRAATSSRWARWRTRPG